MKFVIPMVVGAVVLSAAFAASCALLMDAWHAWLALGLVEVPGLVGPWTLVGLACAVASFVVSARLKGCILGCHAPVMAFLGVVSVGIGLGAAVFYVVPGRVPEGLVQLSCVGWLGALLGGFFGLTDWDISQGEA